MEYKDLNRIKMVLVEKHRTSKWLSEQLGKDPTTVSKWCTNQSQPTLEILLKIAELLGVNYTEFISTRKGVKYLDLFAGAGGFSEGFMQAYTDDKYYDFRLASDINENCELTHRVRYNKMLGLDTKFVCQDIMDDSFLPNLLKEIGNQEIDVVTGGPSCQSSSLAGRRKKLDKRDDLFFH